MKTIRISGTFTDSESNLAVVDFYTSNAESHRYDFRKTFYRDFDFELDDLESDSKYRLDIVGLTFGTFEINVTGDIEDSISETFVKTDFSPGYKIKTV